MENSSSSVLKRLTVQKTLSLPPSSVQARPQSKDTAARSALVIRFLLSNKYHLLLSILVFDYITEH